MERRVREEKAGANNDKLHDHVDNERRDVKRARSFPDSRFRSLTAANVNKEIKGEFILSWVKESGMKAKVGIENYSLN